MIYNRVTLNTLVTFNDTIPTLSKLQEMNIDTPILTNSPPTSKDLFLNSELPRYIKKSYWSFEIGAVKPSAEIFQYMLNDLGCNKEEILFVGDSYKEDYLGSTNFGIDSLLIDRQNEAQIEQRINSLSEVFNI